MGNCSIDLSDLISPPPDKKTPPPDRTGDGAKNFGQLQNSQSNSSKDQSQGLDLPFKLSRFSDVRARHVGSEVTTLRTLAGTIARTSGSSKARLPLLKLGTFGTLRTARGSLRHDGNLTSISGVEGDYDGGLVRPEDAAARLRRADIAALVYTTPSHTPGAPRWRVLCPCSADTSPDMRDQLCARVNGALGGILAPESFTRSQSYYFGAVDGAEPVSTHLIEGRPIDLAADVQGISANPVAKVDLSDLIGGQIEDDDWYQPELDYERIRSALRCIKDASDRQTWLEIGAALHHESGGSNDAFSLWCKWSKRCPEKYNERDQHRTWDSFGRRHGDVIGIGTLYHHAKAAGWTTGEPSRLAFLSPSDCEAAPSRGYLIKGLFAPGDVACIFGAPGAGKSLLAPYLGYAVAQGGEAFGMRTKAGGVFYVAAEDAHGMRGRIKALKAAHDDAPTFKLVEGVSDLLVPDSPDLVALTAAVKEQQPALIFIDTLAMAFPGLEENSAEAMGRVVAIARGLTEWGAAVVLIHHDTKAEGSTPRGHSLLNGALDVALHVKRDETGVIRGKLTKNRNGTCERDIAFRIATEDGGIDEDGDSIMLPRVDELSGADPLTPHLSPKEAAALHAIQIELRVREGFSEAFDLNAFSWEIDAWREACRGDKRLCSTDSRNSQNVAVKRAVEGLIQKGIVTVVTDAVTGKRSAKINQYSGVEL